MVLRRNAHSDGFSDQEFMRMDQLTAPEIKLANPVVLAVRLCTKHCSHVEGGVCH